MIKIIKINGKHKEEYESFLKDNNGSLLQSFKWGDFQNEIGRKSVRFIIKDENDVLGCFQLIKFNLPLGQSYLYCPRGIVVNGQFSIFNLQSEEAAEFWSLFLDKIKEVAKKENSIFFRMDPEWEDKESLRAKLSELGFRKNKKEIQPKGTLILNISKSEDEILFQMHQKARYNIRLAKRKGVEIKISETSEKYFNEFWELMEKTTERDKFKSHLKDYYKKQLDILGSNNNLKLLAAEFEGKIIAAIIVSFYGKNAVYLHGASDYEYRKIMAPHLLQWEAIKEAKKLGCSAYDFWGIRVEGNKDADDWAGITRFKKGFARKFGSEKNYIGAWDLPANNILYRLYETFKK